MTVVSKHLRLLVLTILFVGVLGAAGVASAADPPSFVPTGIKVANFDTAGSTLDIAPLNPGGGIPNSTAYWARMASKGSGGTYGLWCAGTQPAKFPAYPVNTRGMATIAIPADYFTLSLDFDYLMPSYGNADQNSFHVRWFENANPGTLEVHYGYPKSTTTTWKHVFYDLSDGTGAVNLSRDGAGTIQIRFYDYANNAEVVGYDSNNNPVYAVTPNKQGTTLDNVKLTGYKYAPVRGPLGTSDANPPTSEITTGTDIKISWGKPYRARYEYNTPDDRVVTYRVWRSAGGGAWTEVTSSDARIADTANAMTFTDTTSKLPGTAYSYAVQAWDAGTGSGYGQVKTTNAVTTPGTPPPPPPAKPKVSVTKPIACSTRSPYRAVSGILKKYRTYRWAGDLKPYHAVGGHAAYISISKYNYTTKRFVYLRKYTATNTRRLSWTRYVVNFPLGPGRYKLTPVAPEDTTHARTVGSPSYYTVK